MVTFIQNFINIAGRTLSSSTQNNVKSYSANRVDSVMRIFAVSLIVFLVSCKGGNVTQKDTPTHGNIKITADESFQPLIDTEVSTFTQIYLDASIKPQYKPEFDVINDFMNDSVKVIVTSKKLTDDQVQYLRDTLVVARTITFAWDALALVINKQNYDTLIDYNQVRNIFLGNNKQWTDLEPKSRRGKISVIFDNTKSGNIRYFKELFGIKDKLPENFFAVNSNAEVIDFVSRNPDALGIISVNWISDKDDPASTSFLKKVNTVAVSQEMANDGYYYKPLQGSIYDKSYPFVREIYFITRETYNGLGSGLIQFATAEQGQRIVLKSGLVPATMPIRLVQIKK